MNKPINKPEKSKLSPNNGAQSRLNVPSKPTIISKENYKNSTKPVRTNFKGNSNSSPEKDEKTILNPKNNNIKGPKRPSLQLIEKPKNLTNNSTGNNFNRNNNFSNKKPQINRFDKNPNRSSNKNLNNRPNKSTPELVGAPIRREDPKKNSNRQNLIINKISQSKSPQIDQMI